MRAETRSPGPAVVAVAGLHRRGLDPGEAFNYGINIDWLGKVVEAVTGVGLDVAIKQGITGPLGMDQTNLFRER